MIRVDIRNLTYRDRDGDVRVVLKGVRFDLAANEILCLFGPSGAGKTSYLRAVLGFETDFEGEVRIDGEPRMAAVFQEPCLLPWRTVEQNIRLTLPPDLADDDLAPLIEETGLDGHLGFYPGQLSLGLARRVAIARAFAVKPSLLVLDEPFVSLDEGTAQRLRNLLLTLLATRPTAVLMVTHNLDEALELADRIIVIDRSGAQTGSVFKLVALRGARDRALLDAERRRFEKAFSLSHEP